MDGLGAKTAELLLQSGLVKSFSDVFTITKEQLLTLDGFQERKAEQLTKSIKKAKNASLIKWLTALGIRGIGAEVSDLVLAELTEVIELKDLLKIDASTLTERLASVHGLGNVLVQSIQNALNNEGFRRLIADLIDAGVVASRNTKTATGGVFSGKQFAITGRFPVSRKNIAEPIESLGGTVGGISKKTTALILGEKASSKKAKAEAAGVPIWSWEEAKKHLQMADKNKENTEIQTRLF